VNLVENQHFASTLVEFIGKREYPSFGEIEIVEIYIETIPRVTVFVPDKIEQKSSFAHSPKTLDADNSGTPVDLMIEFPDDPAISCTD